MSTATRDKTTPEKHRLALTGFLDDQTLDQEAREAIRWALDRTREPSLADCDGNPRLYRDLLSAMATDRGIPLLWRHALEWALAMTVQPDPPPGWLPEECVEYLSRLGQAAAPSDGETGWVYSRLPEASRMWLAVQWALPILSRSANALAWDRLEKTTREQKTPDLQALAASVSRELRFWKEAGAVSGKVTRRAASRAIRGLEQILRLIPAAPRS